jgi:hypothetical protein
MERSYVVNGRAGPEFQIRVPSDLSAVTGVTVLRLKLPLLDVWTSDFIDHGHLVYQQATCRAPSRSLA